MGLNTPHCTAAIAIARLDVVLCLLNAGADMNAEADNDFTPLHLAEDKDVVALILQKKPDLSNRGRNGNAMQRAIDLFESEDRSESDKKKWREIVNLYLKAGAEYDFFTAIHLGDLERVKTILDKSPHFADDYQDRSPLRIAATAGQLEICRYLIENFKVDINDFKRGVGYPIIKDALPYPKIVKLLIDHKADLKTPISCQGFKSGFWIVGENATALHYAAQDGLPESVKHLLDAGVDLFASAVPLSQVDKGRRQTALDVAAYFGKAGHHGSNAPSSSVQSRLDPAARQTLLDKLLIDGATTHPLGDHPQLEKMVKILLHCGANPLAIVDGKTALKVVSESIYSQFDEHLAEKKNIISLLVSKGARLSLCDAVTIEDEAEVNRLLKLNPRCASDCRSNGISGSAPGCESCK